MSVHQRRQVKIHNEILNPRSPTGKINMSSQLLIQPVAPACGAEVFGIDLADPAPDAMRRVELALAEYSVLFFRDQRLTPLQQLDVTRRFGDILRVPYIQHLDEYPDIIAVLKEADERKISTFGGTWHSDFSFLPEPPSLTLLYALELPQLGGDTLWANQYDAYDSLSQGMKKSARPATCHSDRLAAWN